MIDLSFANVRAGGSPPSQLQLVFSLRDDEGHAVVVPVEELSSSARIFELYEGPSTTTLGLEGLEEGGGDLGGLGDLLGGDLGVGGGTAGADAPVEEVERVWEEIDYAETSFFIRKAEVFEVVFVLDLSNSMAKAILSDGRSGTEVMLDAFEKALQNLQTADRVGVVEFHDRSVEPAIISEITTDLDAVVSRVRAFAESAFEPGSSRVWDSIQTAAQLYTFGQGTPDVVRAMVFISDGKDTSSVFDRNDAGTIAVNSEIQLYAVGVGQVFEEDALRTVAQLTGGQYYPTIDLTRLSCVCWSATCEASTGSGISR